MSDQKSVIELIEELDSSWCNIIKKSLTSNDISHIDKIYSEKDKNIYPPKNELFNAFKYFSINDTRVIILGQDPYHQSGQAHGLAFSVNPGITIPPSLRNIYNELKKEYPFGQCDNSMQIQSGCLINWAKQGVLLLNTALTVEESKPGSHINFWKSITNNIIKEISNQCDHTIFMLWGKKAQLKAQYIQSDKHYIINRAHPSPLSANRGGWFNEQQFMLCNKTLQQWGYNEIKWI